MSLNHPGIKLFNAMAQAIEDPNKVRYLIGEKRNKVSQQIGEQSPSQRSREMIEELKNLEVAQAAACWTDLNHPNAKAALQRAIEGKTATGAPSESTHFAREMDALDRQVCDRVEIKASFKPF